MRLLMLIIAMVCGFVMIVSFKPYRMHNQTHPFFWVAAVVGLIVMVIGQNFY